MLVGCIRKLGITLVPGLMRQFLAEDSAAVQFQLRSGTGFSTDLLKAVEEGRLDMAFTSHPGDPAVFESVAFQRTPFVVITPKDHPLARQKAVSLRDTLPYPQICFAPSSGLRRPVDALFSAIDAAPQIAMETEEDVVVAGLVAAGFGIAVLPEDSLFASLPLAVLPLTEPDPTRTAYLNRRRGTPLPAAAERFWTFCRGKI